MQCVIQQLWGAPEIPHFQQTPGCCWSLDCTLSSKDLENSLNLGLQDWSLESFVTLLAIRRKPWD